MKPGVWSIAVALVLAAVAASVRAQDNVYATYGVHNDSHRRDCADPLTCTYTRSSTEPSDPHFPPYWTSRWAMYRVFKGYKDHMPPYNGAPPEPLKEGTDYQKSYGVTYYDAEWEGVQGHGAMEEHYEKFCLPIFPIANNFTCSFISLGDTAFFVTYDDRPSWMPPVCLFSPRNHPPKPDFIRHLPYSTGDSARLNNTVQGYSIWITRKGKIVQTGASPDRDKDILFGYAFESAYTQDRVEKALPPYRHPQSFYFSGVPGSPPDAPIVSQNYLDFAMVRPEPAKTWAQVSGLDPATLPKCQLFDPPTYVTGGNAPMATGAAAPAEKPLTWGAIGR